MDKEPDFPGLTPHETEVLRRMIEGMTIRAIAAELGMTVAAVGNNRSVIFQKLGVQSRVEAAARLSRPDKDAGLHIALRQLPAGDRELLRRWLAADHEDRESIASKAIKRRTESGHALPKFIAMLSTRPELRERVMRVLKVIDDEPP
jgi:DNA-binding CsgD family transcriptional regulator